MKIRLGDIAYARSGDKGDSVNIGVIAYTAEGYHYLQETLTDARVFDFIRQYNPIQVVRYELPNLWAFNFVCQQVLAGGASLSLRADAQGKALGQRLLELPLEIPKELLKRCRRTTL